MDNTVSPPQLEAPGKTIEQTIYEACNQNELRDVELTGLTFTSETATYTILRPINAQKNLFEAIVEAENLKVLLKLYDNDDMIIFQNEVEKLNLLGQIMEELSEQSSFLVKVIESFQSDEVGSSMGTCCIVMEHMELSLAEYMNNLP